MGFVSAVTSFSTGIGAVASTIDVPLRLGGLTPKVIWCIAFGRTDTSDAAGAANAVYCRGFSVGNGGSRAVGGFIQNAASPTNCWVVPVDTGCVVSLSSAGAVNGQLEVNSFGADTVQFVVGVQFTASLRVHILALAGTDITHASAVTFTPSSSGNYDVTSHGHPGTFFEILSAWNPTNSVQSLVGRMSVGRALANASQHLFAFAERDDLSPSGSVSAAYSGEVLGLVAVGPAIIRRSAFISSLANGFRMNVTETGSGQNVYALVLNGTFRVAIGDFDSATVPGNILFDPGFVPSATDFISACVPKTSADVAQNHAAMSMGFAQGQFGHMQLSQSFLSVDAVSPSDVSTAVDFNSIYLKLASGGSVDGEAGVIAPNVPSTPTQVSITQSNLDAAANMVGWVAFAPADAQTTGFVEDVVTTSIGSGSLTLDLPNLAAAGQAPKVVWLYSTGTPLGTQTIENDDTTNAPFCIGIAVSTTSRVCATYYVDPTGSPIVAFCGADTSSIYSDAVAGVTVDVDDMSTPGEVTLTVTGTPSVDARYIVKAWGGSNISSATITSFVRGLGVGTQVVNTGNTPRYVEVLAAPAPLVAHATLTYGRCWIPTLENQMMAWASEDGVTTSNVGSYARVGEIYGEPSFTSGGAVSNRSSITAGSATGFTFNRISDAGDAPTAYALSISGTFDGVLGTVATRTDQDAISFAHGIATPVKGLEAWSHGLAQSTANTTDAGAQTSIGIAATPNTGIHARAVSRMEADNVVGGLVAAGSSQVDLYQSLDAAGVIDGAMVAVTDGGLYMRDPDPSGVFVMLAAFGDGIAASGGMSKTSARSWLNRAISKGLDG
jgi:hypothetical protein